MEIIELFFEYFIIVFTAAMGVIQAAAGHGERNYFFFFKRKMHGYVFAGLTVIPAMAALFTWNYRNSTGVIEGTQQFYLFIISVVCAMVVSALVTQIVKQINTVPDKNRAGKDIKHLCRSNNNQDNHGI